MPFKRATSTLMRMQIELLEVRVKMARLTSCANSFDEKNFSEYNYNRGVHFNYPSKSIKIYLPIYDREEISKMTVFHSYLRSQNLNFDQVTFTLQQFNRTIKSSTLKPSPSLTPTTVTITNKSPLNFSRGKAGQKTTIPIVPIYRSRPKKDPKKKERREREKEGKTRGRKEGQRNIYPILGAC